MVYAVIERADAPRIPQPHVGLDCEWLCRARAAIDRHFVRDEWPGIEPPVGSDEQPPGLIKRKTERVHIATLRLKVLLAAQNLRQARTCLNAPYVSRLAQ